MSSFMAGVDKKRPPKPKHSCIWDIGLLEQYLRLLGQDNELSWKKFNIKLVALLALTNYKRAADIFTLDVRFCYAKEEEVVFKTMERPKQHRKEGLCLNQQCLRSLQMNPCAQ